jgi:drug/metabolite transporter (DMT)-like permease
VYAALVVASFLWGSLYTAAKPAVAATGATQVMLCRVVLAFVCLGPLVLLRAGGRQALLEPLRRHWRAIVFMGLLNFGVSQMLALSALYFLPASINSVLNNTHPLWLAIGTAVAFQTRRPALLIAGSSVALLGVCLVFLPDLAQTDSGVSPVGVVLSLAGSGVIALGTVVARRVLPGNDPVAISALAAAAVLPVTALTLASGGLAPIFEASPSIKLDLLYVGIGCTAINFALWYYGLKYLQAAAAAAFQYLIPVFGVVLAAIFLGEPLSASLLLGTLCILLGLAATQVSTQPRPHPTLRSG